MTQVSDLHKWEGGGDIYRHFGEIRLRKKNVSFLTCFFKMYLQDTKIKTFMERIFLTQKRNRNLRNVQNSSISQLTSKLVLSSGKSWNSHILYFCTKYVANQLFIWRYHPTFLSFQFLMEIEIQPHSQGRSFNNKHFENGRGKPMSRVNTVSYAFE